MKYVEFLLGTAIHMHSHPASQLWLIKVSITLVLCGAMFLALGAITAHPALYGALLSTGARFHPSAFLEADGVALEDSPRMELHPPHAAPPVAPHHIPQSLYIVGSLLIAGGACLDVRRRLHRLP